MLFIRYMADFYSAKIGENATCDVSYIAEKLQSHFCGPTPFSDNNAFFISIDLNYYKIAFCWDGEINK